MKIFSTLIELQTEQNIDLHDLTLTLRNTVAQSSIQDGFVTITSQHTTTAITINENEARLIEDIKTFLTRLIPPTDKYLHNDIALRDCPPDEPQNAHSHLAAMLLGSSEVITVTHGALILGQYHQSCYAN